MTDAIGRRRFLRRRPFAVCLVISTVVTSCSAGDRSAVDATIETGTSTPPTAIDCSDVYLSAQCRTIDVDGSTYRYGVLEGTDPEHLIVLDIGGPGLSALNAHAPLGIRDVLPPPFDDDTVVFLEEPWVTKPMTTACDAALTDFYATVRSVETSANDASLDECNIAGWGWTPDSYGAVTDAVVETFAMESVGFVGLSYGAIRWYRSGGSVNFDWVVLASPGPPPGDAGRFVQLRADAWTNVFGPIVCPDACDTDEFERKLEVGRTKITDAIVVEGRTVAVDASDYPYALVGLAYLPVDQWQSAADVVGDPNATAGLIGALSDSVWNRIGAGSLSPAYLAYLAEVCTTYDSWTSVDPDGGIIESALVDYHAPCSGIDSAEPAVVADPPPACISVGSSDPVSAHGVLDEWLRVVPGASQVRSTSPGHDGSDGIRRCLMQFATDLDAA